MSKFKVGDKVQVIQDSWNHMYKAGYIGAVKRVVDDLYINFAGDDFDMSVPFKDIVLVEGYSEPLTVMKDAAKGYLTWQDPSYVVMNFEDLPQQPQDKIASDGGPSDYYDLPYKDWVTVNDQMEYLAEHKWGKFGIHLKDIFKGLCRWGDKQNTTVEYDTNKIIYYGLRVKLMLCGKQGVQDYLKKLASDPQFKV